MHTPSFLPATEDTPARIYYAGRSGRHHVGLASRGLLPYPAFTTGKAASAGPRATCADSLFTIPLQSSE